jgi:H+-transporting ATPase
MATPLPTTHPPARVQVASIPIAIEIVCTTTLALGSRQLSAYGAIVTRLQAIEEMAGMNMLCSDKTGE